MNSDTETAGFTRAQSIYVYSVMATSYSILFHNMRFKMPLNLINLFYTRNAMLGAAYANR